MTRGRKSREVEFFKLLSDLLVLKGGPLSRRLGKQAPNVHDYLTGKKTPRGRVLLSSLRHAFEWEVERLVEVRPVGDHARSLPTKPGVYCLYDSSGSVIYVGQATNLKQEVGQTLQRRVNFPVRLGPKLSKKAHPKYKAVATHLSAYQVGSKRMRHNLEALLLRVFPNQSHNNKMGRFM
jgi:hypothetical protein